MKFTSFEADLINYVCQISEFSQHVRDFEAKNKC